MAKVKLAWTECIVHTEEREVDLDEQELEDIEAGYFSDLEERDDLPSYIDWAEVISG